VFSFSQIFEVDWGSPSVGSPFTCQGLALPGDFTMAGWARKGSRDGQGYRGPVVEFGDRFTGIVLCRTNNSWIFGEDLGDLSLRFHEMQHIPWQISRMAGQLRVFLSGVKVWEKFTLQTINPDAKPWVVGGDVNYLRLDVASFHSVLGAAESLSGL